MGMPTVARTCDGVTSVVKTDEVDVPWWNARMHVIELVLSLFVAVAALAYFASRVKVPYPIFLVIGGLALGFIPNLPRVTLDPEVVFVLFLPPILYYGGIMTSWRDFK